MELTEMVGYQLIGYDKVLLAKEVIAHMLKISRVNVFDIRIDFHPCIVTVKSSYSDRYLRVHIRHDDVFVEGVEKNDEGITTKHTKSIVYGDNAMKDVKHTIDVVARILDFMLK